MNRFLSILVNCVVLVSLLGCKSRENTVPVATNNSKYKVGQIWHYKTRPQEPDSTFTVVRMEPDDTSGLIVHVSLRGLKLKNSRHKTGLSDTISHMPFSEQAIDESVTALVKENAVLPDYLEGYNQWKQAHDAGKGGVFTIPVAKAIGFIEESMN